MSASAAPPNVTVRQRRGYTVLPNAAVSDRRISVEARWLLAYLASHSDTWRYHFDYIREDAGVGRDKLWRMLRELREHGYLRVGSVKGPDGRITHHEWTVDVEGRLREEEGAPPEAVDNPCSDQTTEKPESGKSGHIRKPTSKDKKYSLSDPHEKPAERPCGQPPPERSSDGSGCFAEKGQGPPRGRARSVGEVLAEDGLQPGRARA